MTSRRTAALTLATSRLRSRRRHARAVHFDVENRNFLHAYLSKFQLHGARDLGLFTRRDVRADRLGFALHRLRRQLHRGQLVEQHASAIKRSFAADQRCHAAHARRVLRRFDIQLLVAWREAAAATAAMIVRSFDDDRAQHGDEFLRALAGVTRLFAAGARLSRFSRLLFVQQRFKQPRAGLMQGVARRLLDGFKIEHTAVAPFGEHNSQQPTYFFADFLLDRFDRFFSCDVRSMSSSTGRRRQIAILTSTKLLDHC